MTDCFAVISGGGTAGHVWPAIAIAQELEDRRHDAAEIHLVGAKRGREAQLFADQPYPHTLYSVDGLQRGWSRRDLVRNLAFAPRMIGAVAAAWRLLGRLRPRVVVSVGGYASLPAVLAARLRGVPIVVVSFDRTPGKSSEYTARFAAATAAAFPDCPLPRAVHTGAPVRRAVRRVDRHADRTAARQRLGVPVDRFLVAAIGGSLGSRLVNDAISTYAANHRDDAALAIFHVAGERLLDEVPTRAADDDALIHRVVGFEPEFEAVYAACDLLVGRGGASTVADVAVTGTPAILVPWSGAAENHQQANVEWLADAGGALLLPESAIATVGEEIERLRTDPAALAALATNAAGRGATHRAGALGELIERIADGGVIAS